MIITNQTSVDYYFGPMHLPSGAGSTLNLDDTSDTSLYLIDDTVADMVNTLYQASPPLILVSSAAAPFPRPTGTPDVLHGVGSPQGMVYAAQGSLYLRRDNAVQSSPVSSVYVKTTGITFNTGWTNLLPDVSSWQPLILASNVTHATGYFTPAAAMVGSDLFTLSGAVTMTGTVAAGTTLMTLPTGFFPSSKLQATVMDGAFAAIQIAISTSGVVTSGTSWTVANSPYSLDGLTLRLA